jgi:hypothetical protein
MRALLLALPLSFLTLFPGSDNANAGDRHQIAVSDSAKDQSANPKSKTYHGYFLNLSEIAEQQNYTQIVNSLKLQLDIVEGVGLSPRVLKFFHSVPVVIDEFKCLEGSAAAAADDKKPTDKKPTLQAACYNSTGRPRRLQDKQRHVSVWVDEKSEWTNGVVMVRARVLSPERPILLHEMLHAYHAQILPERFKNPSILFYYKEAKEAKELKEAKEAKEAKSKEFYPADAYLMTNEKEFFAVTASVFLYGKDGQEPFTRSKLKEKQPDYYQYLGWLFGTDHAPSIIPVASAD